MKEARKAKMKRKTGSFIIFFLELCRGNAGIPLKDQDTTSKREGEWMKINTLGHFSISDIVSSHTYIQHSN